MDAENLRSVYNTYFSKGSNAWSSTDFKKTRRVVQSTLNDLRGLGFTKEACRVLDVGCGTGYYTQAFHELNCQATGLDYSDVAIRLASEHFPKCRFVLMNGFEPSFNETFDIIFCRGFSGANTHDLEFIAGWVNKYFRYLEAGGYFVFVYSSDFSGKEMEGETANLSHTEITQLGSMIQGKIRGFKLFFYLGWISRFKRSIERIVLRKRSKEYYSLFIEKSPNAGT